jgi:Flp pilus assembly protein TadG
MNLRQACKDIGGGTAIEFGLTAPLFFMIVMGTIEFGLLMWTQVGLQHGAAMAARCATVNSTLCGTASQIQAFAAQQSYGLNPSPSTFSYSSQACGSQVSASYPFQFVVTYFVAPSLTLKAQSCFPK